MSFFLSFLLLLAAFHPLRVASVASANARALGVNDPRGLLGVSVNNAHDILKRQNTTTTTCATIAPLCPGTGACCSGICCTNACCVGGTICSGGQCVANNPTPDPNTNTNANTGTTAAASPTNTNTNTNTVAAQTTMSNGNVPAATTAANTAAGNGTDSGNGTATATATASASFSYFLQYNVTTSTDGNGPEVVTFGSFTDSSTATPTETSSDTTAPSPTPLVVQQVPPTVTNNPDVQMQYEPTNAWETSGDAAGTGNDNGGSGPSNNSTDPNRPISLCNNGTKVSNTVGSTIKLQFIGVEASLLMVPSVRGAKYEVKFDDESPQILDSYKEDGDTCSVSTPWVRTGLDNKPHNVTITIKGDGAGAAGSSGQLEFSGLVFKGPQPTTQSSNSNKWVIVGVSIGGFLILVALGVLLVMCIRKRRVQPSPVTSRPVSQNVGAPPHSRQSTQPMAPQLYPASHMRGDSTVSSGGQPSLPSSPQMSYRTSYFQQTQQPNPVPGSPGMHARTTSWADGGLPIGAQYSPYPVTQPVGVGAGAGVGAASAPYSIPVTYGGNGTPRHSFVQGHARTGSNLSVNRNPFE